MPGRDRFRSRLVLRPRGPPCRGEEGRDLMGSISLGGPQLLMQYAYMICKCRYSQNVPRKISTIPVPPNTKMPPRDQRSASAARW